VAEKLVFTASALMMNEEGQVLLGLRAPWKPAWPDHWDIIGGHVESGETLEEAMIREVREETGMTPTSFRWLACLPERRPDVNGDGSHHIYVVTSWDGGEPSNISDEHSELRWFQPSDLADIPNLADETYRDFVAQFSADGSPRPPHG
jgi:8-oxo-dGTP pyrophosphatase MutT (NUDIX family)